MLANVSIACGIMALLAVPGIKKKRKNGTLTQLSAKTMTIGNQTHARFRDSVEAVNMPTVLYMRSKKNIRINSAGMVTQKRQQMILRRLQTYIAPDMEGASTEENHLSDMRPRILELDIGIDSMSGTHVMPGKKIDEGQRHCKGDPGSSSHSDFQDYGQK